MLITHKEKVTPASFTGTIIDIETIGPFENYPDDDSRQYSKITPTIIGYITKHELNIICAKELENLNELRAETLKLVPSFEKPLFAFQSKFERGVFHHAYGIKLDIHGELNNKPREWKGYACSDLDIPQYDDPFNNDGKLCATAWVNGNHPQAIKHNRSCLLKERDILLKRSYRKPDELNLL
jgi:hypothetical protein